MIERKTFENNNCKQNDRVNVIQKSFDIPEIHEQ